MTGIERALLVVRICLPVFGLIGLGRLLRSRGQMTSSHQDFLGWLTYQFALPSLIFVELVVQPFESLLNPALIIGTISATTGLLIVYSVAAQLTGITGGTRAAFTFGTFWANVSYIGFPLAAAAFGQQKGIGLAAIVNAFGVPFFVIYGFGLIALHGEIKGTRVGALKSAALNPIVLAALLGVMGAWISSLIRSTIGLPPVWAMHILEAMRAVLKLVGSMGLPLALLAVGAAIDLRAVRGRVSAVLSTVAGKLILAPLLTLVIMKMFFPDVDKETVGVAVLLMATPSAVASYVVARRLSAGEDFAASALVISTALSVVTIPVWLYILI